MKSYNTYIISGVFIVAFMVVSFLIALMTMYEKDIVSEKISFNDFIKGRWALLFEAGFNKKVYTYDISKDSWAELNYMAFGEGHDGVLVGKDNWLFTTEEFVYSENRERYYQNNLHFIKAVEKYLEKKNINLIVMLIPAKARVYQGKLGRYEYPDYKKDIYPRTIRYLKSENVDVVDLRRSMRAHKNHDKLFFKTDTHWTPQGAKLAAQSIATYLDRRSPDGNENHEIVDFKTVLSGRRVFEGDLLRYVPTDNSEMIGIYNTVEIDAEEEEKNLESLLFSSEKIPDVTLVGTSYSANKTWNFEGWLKQALHRDVLNAADEGRGPFETLADYLDNAAFKTTPPKLVIWEIPERYMTFEYDLKTEFYNDEA